MRRRRQADTTSRIQKCRKRLDNEECLKARSSGPTLVPFHISALRNLCTLSAGLCISGHGFVIRLYLCVCEYHSLFRWGWSIYRAGRRRSPHQKRNVEVFMLMHHCHDFRSHWRVVVQPAVYVQVTTYICEVVLPRKTLYTQLLQQSNHTLMPMDPVLCIPGTHGVSEEDLLAVESFWMKRDWNAAYRRWVAEQVKDI